MSCPHCGAATTTEQSEHTALGYRKFRCQACKRLFNERTGTPFNFLEYPTDIVLLVIVWRVRYKLSLRDLAEMFLTRGFPLPTRRYGTGRGGLRRCLLRVCAPSAVAEVECRGMPTRHMSKYKGVGVICTAQ